MQQVFKQIALVAPSDVSVLILGESGTGKELVARAIHRHSARKDRPFLPINLAALSPSLVESELFGHVKGAFTGAETARIGLLEAAAGGTVFFDEIGDVPASMQVKLLRVLEQQELTRIGETTARPCDFRVVAATHRDLKQSLDGGEFRQDLYFRLAGFEIPIPPLRERTEDIPLLAEHFLRRIATPSARQLSTAAVAALGKRPWFGNVRELRSAVEHAAIVARGGTIEPEHFPPPRSFGAASGSDATSLLQAAVRRWADEQLIDAKAGSDIYGKFLLTAEGPLFESVLRTTQQNRAAAAEILGIHRATLRKKM